MTPEIIVYHYKFSPYARRIVWYLQLRNIPYIECLQPPTMPRADLALLSVSHRRIPIVSINRDIYVDTRLILLKLDALIPASASHPSITPSTPLTPLLSSWTTSTPLFFHAATLIPPNIPLLADPKFRADRAQYSGRSWDAEARAAARPEALVEIASAFVLLESMLADGRQWIAGNAPPGAGDGPTRADVEAVWPFHWLWSMRAYPKEVVSSEKFPRAWAWIERFDKYMRDVAKERGKVGRVDGKDAAEKIWKGKWVEESVVQESDPSGLKGGELVEVWPLDSGSGNRDRGVLVGLSLLEVVIELGEEGKRVRIHAPRHGFRFKAVDAAKL